jgi:hypothetical protein
LLFSCFEIQEDASGGWTIGLRCGGFDVFAILFGRRDDVLLDIHRALAIAFAAEEP